MSRYPENELAQLVLYQCVKNNIGHVVISPGSRNAPLTIGFVNQSNIETYSIVDERCAAFFALGIAQQTQKPVGLVCTSGSALLNYYPAIAEAYYSNIPLIVISADRPIHLREIGDGQTIRQEDVFKNHIHFSANLNDQTTIDSFRFNEDLLNEIFKTISSKKGPVHINIPFDEPLYNTIEEFTIKSKLKKNIVQDKRNSLLDQIPIEVDELQNFANIWNKATKKMVLIGSRYPDALIQTQVDHLVKDPSVLVLTETTSNVYHDSLINNIDKLLVSLDESDLEDLKPEVLITFGGMVVSKKIKQFLRKYQPNHHWHVDRYNAMDTYHCMSHYFSISSQLFFSQFFFLTIPKESDYQLKWIGVKQKISKQHDLYLKEVIFSDLKAFDIIVKSIPDNSNLQLANSSIVRYSQLFDLKKSLQVFCNRGTSGIDGSTSTAIGFASIHQNQTVLITGDISFFYDSNALWNKYIKNDFRIILINNSGGGIFRFIPGPKTSDALDYFETPHNLNASHLCKMFDIEYASAKDEKELSQNLISFYNTSTKPKLLEIFTPSEKNDLVLKGYFSNLNNYLG